MTSDDFRRGVGHFAETPNPKFQIPRSSYEFRVRIPTVCHARQRREDPSTKSPNSKSDSGGVPSSESGGSCNRQPTDFRQPLPGAQADARRFPDGHVSSGHLSLPSIITAEKDISASPGRPQRPCPRNFRAPELKSSGRKRSQYGVGSGETRGLFLVGWEGGIPAPDKSYAPDCTPCGERTILPSTTDTETFAGLALRISSASGFSTRRCMTRLRGRAPKSAS